MFLTQMGFDTGHKSTSCSLASMLANSTDWRDLE